MLRIVKDRDNNTVKPGDLVQVFTCGPDSKHHRLGRAARGQVFVGGEQVDDIVLEMDNGESWRIDSFPIRKVTELKDSCGTLSVQASVVNFAAMEELAKRDQELAVLRAERDRQERVIEDLRNAFANSERLRLFVKDIAAKRLEKLKAARREVDDTERERAELKRARNAMKSVLEVLANGTKMLPSMHHTLNKELEARRQYAKDCLTTLYGSQF